MLLFFFLYVCSRDPLFFWERLLQQLRIALAAPKQLAPLGGGRLGVWSAAVDDSGNLELQCILDAAAYGLGDGGVSGTWTDRVWTAEECATRKQTAYEIFQNKGWNAVDSSFSGLGLNQI